MYFFTIPRFFTFFYKVFFVCLTLRLLIQHGADVNAQTTSGDTPCHLAAYRGHREAVKVLVEAGADLEMTNARFRTPYDDAERQGHFDLLPLLDAANQSCK